MFIAVDRVTRPARLLEPEYPYMSLSDALFPQRRLFANDPLTSLVERVAANTDWWSPRVEFHQPRWWTKLIGTPDVDVWLLTWLTDQTTEFHDHGASRAAFTVVQGRLTEYRAEARGEARATVHGPGAVSIVQPREIHDVVNLETEAAISIHAYSPPLRSMTYYSADEIGLSPTHTELYPKLDRPWSP